MTKQQLWSGATMILAGSALMLSSLTGYAITWPLWAIGSGLILLLAPWTTDRRKQRNMRMGGVWSLLAGIAGLAAQLGLPIGYGPIYMIGAGVVFLIYYRDPKREA